MCPLQSLFIFPAIFFICYAVFGIITGKLFSKGGWIYREDSPLLFYFVVASCIIFSIICFNQISATPESLEHAKKANWGAAIIFALFAIIVGAILIYTIRSQNKD